MWSFLKGSGGWTSKRHGTRRRNDPKNGKRKNTHFATLLIGMLLRPSSNSATYFTEWRPTWGSALFFYHEEGRLSAAHEPVEEIDEKC